MTFEVILHLMQNLRLLNVRNHRKFSSKLVKNHKNFFKIFKSLPSMTFEVINNKIKDFRLQNVSILMNFYQNWSITECARKNFF